MALKYRNEQVISSLRSAYTLKHSSESWFLDLENSPPRDHGDLEHNILNLKLNSDPDRLNVGSNPRRIRSKTNRSSHFPHEASNNTSPQKNTSKASESPTLSSSASMDATSISGTRPRGSSLVASNGLLNQLAPNNSLTPVSPVSSSPVSTLSRPVSTHSEAPDSTVSDSELAVSQNAKSLMRWKEMGLDLGDDSDFEETILQSGRSLTYNPRLGQNWRPQSLHSSKNGGVKRENPRNEDSLLTPTAQLDPLKNATKSMNPKGTMLSSPGPNDSADTSVLASSSLFAKRDVSESQVSPSNSRLTSMLTSRGGDPREQYLEAVAGLRGNGKTYKMHIPGKDPITINVKPDCSTHLAIGYTLLKADVAMGDANMYTLRLTEDDGEVDEDFPALDRVRPVASYHTDEFAIINATEAEYRENCKRTPNKVAFKNESSGSQSASTRTGTQKSGAGTEITAPFTKTSLAEKSITSHNRDPTASRQDQRIPSRNDHASEQQQNQRTQNTMPFPPAHSMPYFEITPSPTLPTAKSHARPPLSTFAPSRKADINPSRPPSSSGNQPLASHSRTISSARPQRSFASSLSGTKFESILVRVYMYPYDPLLSPVFWSDDMATRQTKMADVFEQMCRDKMMDPEMFILRTADPARQQIDLQKQLVHFMSVPQGTGAVTPSLSENTPNEGVSGVSSSSNNNAGVSLYVDIEVVALRNLPGASQTALRPRASSKNGDISISSATDTSMGNSIVAGSGTSHLNSSGSLGGSGNAVANINGPSTGQTDTTQDILKDSVLAMQQPFGFYKYPVVRLKVLGGSAKEFVIDGENIHIMPPSDRSMVDQPKTTSFHIRQVIRVKQSRKTDTNFSIAIMKPGGPKTYDLECKTPQISHEIVDRLQRLKAARSK